MGYATKFMTMRQTYSSYRLVNFIKFVISFFLVATFVTLFTKSLKRREDVIIIRDLIDSSCLSPISTCSCEADLRGPNQSVVSFSLYGDWTDPAVSDRYIRPLRALTSNISRIYPDWIVRIYHNFSTEDGKEAFKKMLNNSFNKIDFCDIDGILRLRNIRPTVFPMTWRFLPLLDPLVDRFMSRDTDSELIGREIDAVGQWLTASDATFHAMRDHPWHCHTEILGGLWGAKVHQRRRDIGRVVETLFQRPMPSFHGVDQLLLKFYVWPLAAKDSVIHDSYCCETFPSSSLLPFPTRRQDSSSFVGSVYANQSLPPPGMCPEKCRPQRHPDWNEC